MIAIADLQFTLKEIAIKKFTFTGDSFYTSDNDIRYYDTNESNLDNIVDIGLLFPINKSESDLLNTIFNNTEDKVTTALNKYTVPSLLKSKSNANVVNKIHSLIPMGA